MTQREEIAALREEIAKLHKDVEALTAAMLQLAVNTPQPYFYPVPYVPYQPPMYPYWYTTGVTPTSWLQTTTAEGYSISGAI